MKAKIVVPRALAQQDVQEALAYYQTQAGSALALRFVDALEQAYAHLSLHGGSGSPRYAHELNIPGLRAWALTAFPYTVFYREEAAQIDVWRVLHQQRDLPAWMQTPEP
ncbi:MAG: type II toxin-antitoxin system RelE/ParE family toxin [Cellvibrionales bacterium]|nr:MAG: type II toxin-antitoxin system RelE/ParE family toxin [Cellvibrionales bacterium]